MAIPSIQFVFMIFCGITTVALLTVLNLLLPGKVERTGKSWKATTSAVLCNWRGCAGAFILDPFIDWLYYQFADLAKPWQSKEDLL